MNKDMHNNALQPDYHLLWYRIKRVLGKGAFGITYLALDINLERLVAIKEYMPEHLAMRSTDLLVHPVSSEHQDDFNFGLGRFISEGRTLTRFEHPNLVRVFNAFEANNTAYMVMNYEVGESLHEVVKRRKNMNEGELKNMILPLLDGLLKMHAQGFIHRDIKPGNIFIRKEDGGPVLLDFGSARQTRVSGAQTLTNFVSPGYAPIEQYSSNSGKQGPWTDIYGLGATIYKIITGTPPLNAVDRGEAIMHDGKDCYIPLTQLTLNQYSPAFLGAVDHALAFRSSDRPQSINDWKAELSVSGVQVLQESRIVAGLDTATGREDEKTTKIETTAEPVVKTRAVQPEPTFESTIKLNPDQATAEKPVTDKGKVKAKSSMFLKAAAVIMLLLVVIGVVLMKGGEEESTEVVTTISGAGPASTAETDPTDITMTQAAPPEQAEEVSEQTDSVENPEVAQLLEQADNSIKELRLTSPAGNNAYEQYQQVLALDPGNENATAGIRDISDKYIALAYGAMRSDKIDKARSYIDKAGSLWPESEKIPVARQALQSREDEIAMQKEKAATETTVTSTSAATSGAGAAEEGDNGESGGIVGGVKKWFRDTAEKNKDAGQQKGTGSDFVETIGGGKQLSE